MGNIGFWIVPIIALVIWIISSLAKGNEAARKAPLPRQRPPQRPRPVTSDIDRFLEEIQRQRQMQRRPTAEAIPTVLPAPVETRKPVRPKPPQRPRPAPTVRPRRVKEPVVVVREAVVEPELILEPESPPPRKAESAITPPTISRAAPSLHLAELLKLIRSPHGMRTAFVLSTVLGPPKCRRGR